MDPNAALIELGLFIEEPANKDEATVEVAVAAEPSRCTYNPYAQMFVSAQKPPEGR